MGSAMNPKDIQIGNAGNLHWMWIVLVILALAVFSMAWQRRAALRFATTDMLARIFPPQNIYRIAASVFLVLASMTLLVLCIVDVRWGKVQLSVQYDESGAAPALKALVDCRFLSNADRSARRARSRA